jgi:hypothetical protein
MMIMRTGRIPEHQAVEGAVWAMAITITMENVRSACGAVRKGPGKGREQRTEKGKGMGKGKGNGKGQGSVKQTPGGDDISCAVALQLKKQRYEADSDMEG